MKLYGKLIHLKFSFQQTYHIIIIFILIINFICINSLVSADSYCWILIFDRCQTGHVSTKVQTPAQMYNHRVVVDGCVSLWQSMAILYHDAYELPIFFWLWLSYMPSNVKVKRNQWLCCNDSIISHYLRLCFLVDHIGDWSLITF